MKTGMYPRIALGSIRKNGRLYIPFFAASILMVAVYYILHFLAYSGITKEYVGSSTATDMLALGTYVMAVFGTIFLFYTQSALIKGRKNEFGLYSVLGMNRHNLGRIVFFETLISLGIALAGGLTAGIGLSKLAELAFSRMVSVPVNYRFSISVRSVITTVIIYSIIFFLIYLNSLRQVRFTKTIDLIKIITQIDGCALFFLKAFSKFIRFAQTFKDIFDIFTVFNQSLTAVHHAGTGSFS